MTYAFQSLPIDDSVKKKNCAKLIAFPIALLHHISFRYAEEEKKKRCISHQMTSMQYHVYPIHRSIQHESQCWEEIKMKWRQSGTWNASQIHWRKRTNSPNRGQLIRLCHVLFAISFELKCLICCLLSNETTKKVLFYRHNNEAMSKRQIFDHCSVTGQHTSTQVRLQS